MPAMHRFLQLLLVVALFPIPGNLSSQAVVLDEGTFLVEIGGRRIGTETFRIRRAGFGDNTRVIAQGNLDLVEDGEFIEVFMNTPLSTCEDRDPKGLYKMARKGEIKNFTGIDSGYEPPETPEITLDSSTMSIEECADAVVAYLQDKGVLPA